MRAAAIRRTVRGVVGWLSSVADDGGAHFLSSTLLPLLTLHFHTPHSSFASVALLVPGICRTCEIFGAKSLVLPDKRLVSHDAFKALSMGGERWIPLEQVRPSELPMYLQARRAAGWRVVALEQARGSVPLHQYAGEGALSDRAAHDAGDAAGEGLLSAPRRTVLLLGAEGTGVPAPLLSEVDDCVEIPQRGLLRSLNVHVSAAIAVYEMMMRHEAGEADGARGT